MFPSVKSVKSNSLNALRGNWAQAVMALAIPVLSVLAVGVLADAVIYLMDSLIIQVIFSVVIILTVIFLGLPSCFGVLRLYHSLYTKENIDFSEIFYYFSSKGVYLRAVRFIFSMVFPLTLAAFLLLVPSIALDFIANGGIDELFQNGIPIWIANLSIIATFLRCLAIAAVILISLKVYVAPYIFMINDKISVKEVLMQSIAVSRYGAGPFILLVFTQLGWVLLSILAVPAVFTLPYMLMCYVTHSKYAVNFYNGYVKSKHSCSDTKSLIL